MPAPPLIAVAASLALLGLVLLVLARRGRRIDDHPICRKCRFDLVGVCGVQAIASWVNA